jgi:hypothetical protein
MLKFKGVVMCTFYHGHQPSDSGRCSSRSVRPLFPYYYEGRMARSSQTWGFKIVARFSQEEDSSA